MLPDRSVPVSRTQKIVLKLHDGYMTYRTSDPRHGLRRVLGFSLKLAFGLCGQMLRDSKAGSSSSSLCNSGKCPPFLTRRILTCKNSLLWLWNEEGGRSHRLECTKRSAQHSCSQVCPFLLVSEGGSTLPRLGVKERGKTRPPPNKPAILSTNLEIKDVASKMKPFL